MTGRPKKGFQRIVRPIEVELERENGERIVATIKKPKPLEIPTEDEAQKIVDAKDLKRLETKIQISKEVFDETILYLAEAGKEAIGISKRMELVNIQNSFKEIKKSRLVDNEIEDVSTSKPLFSLRI